MLMPTNPVSIGFNVPFNEAIAQAVKRGVVLPDIYYGQLQGLARQQAFSIAGITSLDTLQAVKESLDKVIAEGGTFGAWKKHMLESGTLNLPKHRLDNIYRTNLQGSYMAARWDRILLTQATRPYIMYDALNDSRVRPAHLALDGIIRRVDDPFWTTHSPPNGYRCRCSIRSLSEHQARARSGPGKGLNNPALLEDGTPALPDKGWDYNPSDRLAGVNKALVDKRGKSSPVLMQALDAKLAGMEESKLKLILGSAVYNQARQALAVRKIDSPLTEAEQVALYAWTLDTGNDALFRKINNSLRTGEGIDELEPMIALMSSALDKLPNYEGKVYRAIKRGDFSGKFPKFDNNHVPFNYVMYKGFTGTSKNIEGTLRGNIRLNIKSLTGKDISAFSRIPAQKEILFLPDSVFYIENRVNFRKEIELWLLELPLGGKTASIKKMASKW